MSKKNYPIFNEENDPLYFIDECVNDFKIKKFKIHDFKFKNSKKLIFSDLEDLHRNSFSHVINMNGNLEDICRIARSFGICFVDLKLNKFIADSIH